MVVKYPKTERESIFDLNPVLKQAFPHLKEEEMRYVALVGDVMSPFRFKENKHELAIKVIGKRVKRAYQKDIEQYDTMFNPPKTKRLRDMLNSYYTQFQSMAETIAYADTTGDKTPEETIKIQELSNRIIKDGLDKKVLDSIEFYETKLAYEFTPPSEVADTMNKEEGKQSETADDVDADSL